MKSGNRAISLVTFIGIFAGARNAAHSQFDPQSVNGETIGPAQAAQSSASVPRSYRLAASTSLDREPDEVVLPIDIAVGSNRMLYVADFTSNTVVVFDEKGTERNHWRPSAMTCDDVFVPIALDISPQNEIAVLWRIVPNTDGRPIPGRSTSFIDIRTPDGRIVGSFHTRSNFTDISIFNRKLFLVQPSTVSVSSFDGAFDDNFRLIISSVRTQAGSFDLFADNRVASIKDNGTVHIQTVNPYTTKSLELRHLVPHAIDVFGDTLYVLAGDRTESRLHLLQFDSAGALLRDVPLSDLSYQADQLGTWPLNLTVGSMDLGMTTLEEAGLLVIRQDEIGRSTSSIRGGSIAGIRLDQPAHRSWTSCTKGSTSLGTATTAGVLVYDHDEQRLISYDDRLTRKDIQSLDMGLVTLDATGPDPTNLVMLTESDQIIRTDSGPFGTPLWSIPCNCRALGRIALAGSQVVVGRRTERHVQRYDQLTGQTGMEIRGQTTSEIWPFDVGLYSDGDLVTTDLAARRLERIDASGRRMEDVDTGYTVGPQFVAVYDSPEVGKVIVTSMGDNHIELRDFRTGNLLVRWLVEDNGVPIRASDIAIDAKLRVYIIDARTRVLYRFDPQSTEVPTPEVTPVIARTTCQVTGDKVAGPRQVVLGETASITLSIRADCPMGMSTIGADIVVVADKSASTGGTARVIMKNALTDFGNSINLSRHRIALVTFAEKASVVSPLSHQRRDLGELVDEIGNGTIISTGLNAARNHILAAAKPNAIPIIVLFSDGGDGIRGDSAASAVNEAQRAKDAGIQIFAVAIGSLPNHTLLRSLASGPAHYFATWTPDDLYFVVRQIAEQIAASRIGNLVLADEMSSEVEYVEGSAFPPGIVDARRVVWGRSVLPSTGITLSLKVRPLRSGRNIPTNKVASARYTDADGSERSFVFPVPNIDVITASPTPPATSTVTPTRVPAVDSLYLPVILREPPCQPELSPLDVMLVIDASNSMSGDKLSAAQDAASAFTGMLNLGKDRVGLISFNSDARLLSALTTSGDKYHDAIRNIQLAAGTRLDSGLALAIGTMLANPRPLAQRAVILLTDGRQDSDPQAAISAADAMKMTGIDLFAVGLGGDADMPFLRQLVDSNEKVRFASNGPVLIEIYATLARELPCDKRVWWGSR